MSVTIETIRTDDAAFELWFTSTESDPTFYIYINGVLVATTDAPFYFVDLPDGGSAILEVFDDSATLPSSPPVADTVTLQWYRPLNQEIDRYSVRQYDGVSAWDEIGIIYDTGLEAYQFETDRLDDDTVHQFRIVSFVSENGTESDPRTMVVHMKRRPDAPSATYTYDSGTGNDTVTF